MKNTLRVTKCPGGFELMHGTAQYFYYLVKNAGQLPHPNIQVKDMIESAGRQRPSNIKVLRFPRIKK